MGVGDGYAVGGMLGTAVGSAAMVAATDCRIKSFGFGVGRFVFGEQPANRNRIRLTVKLRCVCFFIPKL